MPTAGGPNTLGESNLVFAYDTGDVKNSYIGEPTTNLVLFNVTVANFNNDYGGNLVSQTADYNVTYRGRPSLRVVTVGQWNLYKPGRPGNFTATSSTVFTFSWKIKWSDGRVPAFVVGYIYTDAEYLYPGVTVTPLEDGWYLCQTTGGGTSSPIWLAGFNSTQTGTCYVTDWQVETKSHATQFTTANTTRSATQGLLPLIGNSTINLSNVSFDSNAKMVFDGTNDYVDCGAIQPFDLSARNVTWEAVVKFNDTSGVEAVITRWDNTTGMIWWVGRYPTTKMHVAFIINGSYYDYYSNGDIGTAAGYHHIVATLNNTVLIYYINGVLDSTDTVTAGTWTSDPDPSLIIGAQNQGAAANINGEIPVAKIYNRALTAQEVKQNYQQYKTRFNLS